MSTSVVGGAVGTAAPPARLGPPPGTDEVRAALRLGWYLAEVRGRHWWRGQRPPVVPIPASPPYALPLRPERTAAESRGAARDALSALAEELGVAHRYEDGPDVPSFPQRLRTLAAGLESDLDALVEAPAGEPTESQESARDTAWTVVAALLHDWDCAIQDALTARADMLANGYLLGRGLAECYWALGPDEGRPDVPPSSTAWAFLLGPERSAELGRLVGRVAAHLPPLTPTAVDGSLHAWSAVALDPAWRAHDGLTRLFEQYRRWYELLVLGREPTTYVRPYALLHGRRTALRAFRAFWPQLALAAASAVAVAAVVYFLSTQQGDPVVTTLLGLFGAVGLAAARVVAKAKSAGQQLLARLRQDAYSDLVAIAVTVVPQLPGRPDNRRGRRVTDRRVRAAVRRRGVTPVTPMPDAPLPVG